MTASRKQKVKCGLLHTLCVDNKILKCCLVTLGLFHWLCWLKPCCANLCFHDRIAWTLLQPRWTTWTDPHCSLSLLKMAGNWPITHRTCKLTNGKRTFFFYRLRLCLNIDMLAFISCSFCGGSTCQPSLGPAALSCFRLSLFYIGLDVFVTGS